MHTTHAFNRLGLAIRVVAAIWILSGAAKTVRSSTTPSVNALWVYSTALLPNPVTDSPTTDALIQNGSASGVNMLYVSVYSSTADSAGRLLVNESSIASFIGKAHAQGMQVYAALGDTDWPSFGCAVSDTPYKRLSDVIGYDSAHPSAKFDGIILDVEPGSNPDFPSLLGLYSCFQQQAHAGGLGLSAAVSAFWSASVTYNKVTKEAYKQIVDLKLNNVVVMGYRNFAGTLDCTQGNGVICLDGNIIQYANSVSLSSTVLVGLNTDNPVTSGALPEETFYSIGQTAMNLAAQSVVSQLSAVNLAFGGFAIHNYRDAYLSGQAPGWPATNPTPLVPVPLFQASAVVNAASYAGGSVAPGEMISIFGQNLGPATPQGPQVAGGKVTTSLSGVQVLFNGVPAPMMLAYSTQVNAIVPFEVQGSVSATVQVQFGGLSSAPVTVPVAAAAPGIFTADSSGKGPGAIFNQGYSYNNSSAPAAPGSTVTLYLTGAGATTPTAADGLVSQDPGSLARPTLPVTAEVGLQTAAVSYAGDSVGIVSGVIQVNLVIPAGLSSGPQPLTLKIGSAASQSGVTVAVR